MPCILALVPGLLAGLQIGSLWFLGALIGRLLRQATHAPETA